MNNKQQNNNNQKIQRNKKISCCTLLFYCFSVSLFSLLGLLTGLFLYQSYITPGVRLAFHAHKTEAYWLYAGIARFYDEVINIWHWSEPMRDRAFQDNAALPVWARWNKTSLVKRKILDVGAGTGFFTSGAILASNPLATEVTMLDQSDHQLHEASKKALLNNTKKIIGDSHMLPFPPDSFDAVISAGSIEYWPQPAQAISEMLRVLKPGGTAHLVGPIQPTHWLARQLASLWYLFPTEAEYIQWFTDAGFEQVEFIQLDPEWYFSNTTSKMKPDRQYGLIMGSIVVARRGSSDLKKEQQLTEAATARLEKYRVSQENRQDIKEEMTALATVYSLGRFILGGVGALYYTFLPIFIALKRGLPESGIPALGDLPDYALGLVVAEMIWIFVSAHLEVPDNAHLRRGRTTSTTSGGISLRSIFHLARPHTIKGTFVAILVGYFLASTFTLNYTEHLATGLHILLSGIAVNIYIVALNQLTDVEIDIENNKPLPLVTGELSWNEAKFITHISFLIASSLAIGGVNTTWWILVVMLLALLGTVYSIEPYRLKRHSSTAALSIAVARGLVAIIGGVSTLLEVFHVSQEDLHAFPIWEMGLTFTAILFTFCTVIAIAKDVPDVHGDRKAKISTLALKIGSANIMKICFATLLLLYSCICVVFAVIGDDDSDDKTFFLFNKPFKMDSNISMVGLHLVAAAYLIKSFISKWNRLEDQKICIDIYINVIWNLFYFELVAFPVPCLIEVLRFRNVLSASKVSNSVSYAVVIAAVAPLFLMSYVQDQFRTFSVIADKITQVRSIKNSICQRVLNDKELFSQNLPPLNEDSGKIFDGKIVTKKQVEEKISSTTTTTTTTKQQQQAEQQQVKTAIEQDNQIVRAEISDLIGLTDLHILHEAAGHLFKNPGKMIRSRIISLLSRTLLSSAQIQKQTSSSSTHKKCLTLAVCTEMSHTASLLHDDVVDESATRRGMPSASQCFGNKLAILAGDFLFSRALRHLTVNVGIEEVTANVSKILEDLTKGEVVQMSPNGNPAAAAAIVEASSSLKKNNNNNNNKNSEKSSYDDILQDVMNRYKTKIYLKTASLFSLTCKSVATIISSSTTSNTTNKQELEFYAQTFGQHFGMMFQIVDDLLDFVVIENNNNNEDDEVNKKMKKLGKPVGQDLKLGLATLPDILAAKRYPLELIPLILRNFSQPGDVETAMDIVTSKDKDNKRAFAEARELFIKEHLQKAVGCLMHFPQSSWRDELIQLVIGYNGF